eukprot:2415643-Amphidinium_carterae.1
MSHSTVLRDPTSVQKPNVRVSLALTVGTIGTSCSTECCRRHPCNAQQCVMRFWSGSGQGQFIVHIPKDSTEPHGISYGSTKFCALPPEWKRSICGYVGLCFARVTKPRNQACNHVERCSRSDILAKCHGCVHAVRSQLQGGTQDAWIN